MLTKDQVQRYFDSRLSGQRLNWNLKNVPAHCPHHDDQKPSLSIHSETGRWKCHSCGRRGQLLDFEKELGGNPDSVAESIGLPVERIPQAIYSYTDAFGNLLFEKIRFPGKKFLSRRRDGDKWVWNLNGIEDKPIYQLKRAVVSRFLFICNGEKAADRLNEEFDRAGKGDCCATCTYDGEGKWRHEYARYFAGKAVSVFPDNDAVGKEHAETVARDLYGTAHVVKLVPLPVAEKGDVFDYLGEHPLEDLLEEVKKASIFRMEKAERRRRFVSAEEFMSRRTNERIDWLVQGAIQRGGNGMIVAPPGSGKSYLMLDLAISLATGSDFLGIGVPRPVRVAVMSREDHPDLTRWRMKHLWIGKGYTGDPAMLANLWINTREDMPQFALDNDEYMRCIMDDLNEFRPEMIFLDVLKVMHGSDENDNTAMHRIMSHVTGMTTSLGCSACIVHHQGYATRGGSLKLRARGASAIGGWPEWVLGLSITNSEDPQKEWIRRVDFESKMAAPHDPVEFMIWSEREDGPLALRPLGNRTQHQNPQPATLFSVQ